jgi:hypothetical protein
MIAFWVRHVSLIVLGIILPFGAALYLDTEAELSRARQTGIESAELAADGLQARLRLHAHQQIGTARELTRALVEAVNLARLDAEGPRTQAEELLSETTVEGGFTWVLGPDGVRRVAVGIGADDATPRSFVGHPVFVHTQQGYAFDTVWKQDGRHLFVVAAPIVDDERAAGAVVRGAPLDAEWLESVSHGLGAELVLRESTSIVASTLPTEAQSDYAAATASEVPASVQFGRLDGSIASSDIPLLPLFVDHRAKGFGRTAVHRPLPGSESLQWGVAVRSGASLASLGSRQGLVLAAMLVSFMLAVLVGLINSRTFIRPLSVIESHLSEIQMGRGEVELPEPRVSPPYRRLVRLINMTVQKIPTRGYSPSASSDLRTLDDSGASRPPSSPRIPAAPAPTPAAAASSGPVTLESTDIMPTGTGPLGAAVPDLGAFAASPTETSGSLPGVAPMEAAGGSLPGRRPQPSAAAFPAPSLDLDAIPPPPASAPGAPPPQVPRDLAPEEDLTEATQPLTDQFAATDEAVAAAIESLTEPPARRSAADIRGSQPRGTPPSPYRTDDLSLGVGLRGGGSLETGAAAEHPTRTMDEQALAQRFEDAFGDAPPSPPSSTVVDEVSPPPPPATVDEDGLDAADRSHFEDIYRQFVDLRRKVGEAGDPGFDRFSEKLLKNRDALIKKYNCRTVRFQVYEKEGRAALKATPVRS